MSTNRRSTTPSCRLSIIRWKPMCPGRTFVIRAVDYFGFVVAPRSRTLTLKPADVIAELLCK